MAADWRDKIAERDDDGNQVSESTVRRYVREARCFFGQAVTEKIIQENPFTGIAGTSLDVDKTWATVTRKDLDQILAACPSDEWRMLFSLCRLAGLRRGEAMRLKWQDVDLNGGRLIVLHTGKRTTKKRTRQVPITPELEKILFPAFMADGNNEYVCGRLRYSERSGNIHRDARAIIEKAGLDVYSKPFHTLRKNLETEWMNEYPLSVVCEWLGNSPEVAMKHYTRAEEEHFARASRKVLDSGTKLPQRSAEEKAKDSQATTNK